MNLPITGKLIVYLTKCDHILLPLFANISDKSEIILKSVTLLMLFLGTVYLAWHRFVEVKNIKTLKGIKFKNKRKDILKLGLIDSTKMVFTSRYLAIICILMIFYSISVNLIEGRMYRAKAMHP